MLTLVLEKNTGTSPYLFACPTQCRWNMYIDMFHNIMS